MTIDKDQFALACEMLPEDVYWGDHLTPYIVLDILRASESNQVATLEAELTRLRHDIERSQSHAAELATENERLRSALEAVKRERNAAFKMSRCECSTRQRRTNLVAKNDQIAKARERTAREWLVSLVWRG